jgi:hypothetical protein
VGGDSGGGLVLLKLGCQLLLQLLLVRFGGLLFRQVVQFLRQRLDLLVLLALHPLEILLQLPQLPFEIFDLVGRLPTRLRGAPADHKGENRKSRCEVAMRMRPDGLHPRQPVAIGRRSRPRSHPGSRVNGDSRLRVACVAFRDCYKPPSYYSSFHVHSQGAASA